MTLSKIAKLAHVSVSTVSKAFSESNEINEQTREEIFKIAKELGCFKKYYNAKYPKFVIAVICPEFKSSYYSSALSFIQEYLSDKNCEICVAETDFSKEKELELLKYYNLYTSVDGIIIINGHTDTSDYEIPIINIGSAAQGAFNISNDYKNPVQTDWNARDFFMIRIEPKTIKPSGELQELRAHRTWSGEHGHQPVRRTP